MIPATETADTLGRRAETRVITEADIIAARERVIAADAANEPVDFEDGLLGLPGLRPEHVHHWLNGVQLNVHWCTCDPTPDPRAVACATCGLPVYWPEDMPGEQLTPDLAWEIRPVTVRIGTPATGAHHMETTYALVVKGVVVADEFYDQATAETAAYHMGLPGAALPPQPAVDAAVSDLVSEVLKAA